MLPQISDHIHQNAIEKIQYYASDDRIANFGVTLSFGSLSTRGIMPAQKLPPANLTKRKIIKAKEDIARTHPRSETQNFNQDKSAEILFQLGISCLNRGTNH